jgi:transposase-like protein
MVLALAEARKDGRVRLVRINDNRTETLLGAIRANVAGGSSVTTDGWRGYHALPRAGYPHTRLAHPKNWTKTGQRSTPHADEVISASKRWLVGTYQKPARAHLPVYLAEFCFRREIRDPGARFEALLRALMASPVRTRTHMREGADLPPVPGRVAPPNPAKPPAKRQRKAPAKPRTRHRRAVQPTV